jgi:hypothetical protein
MPKPGGQGWGHVRPGERIREEAAGHDYHWPADGPPGGLEDDNDAGDADDHVEGGRHGGPRNQLFVKDDDVQRRRSPGYRQQKVEGVDFISPPAAPGGIKEKDQDKAEAEVNGALQRGVQHPEDGGV